MRTPLRLGAVRPRRPSTWTLRTRLLAALLALLALVSLVIGLVSVFALDSFLNGRLDESLRSAAERSGRPPRNGVPLNPVNRPQGNDLRPLEAPGQSEGTVLVVVRDGVVAAAGYLDSSGDTRPLAVAPPTDIPVDGHFYTADLGEELGTYRLVAAREDDGDVVITGLPLRPVRAAVFRLAAVVTVVSVFGLLLAGLVGALIVRLTLRPLRRVAATATRVSELPLHEGEVALAERVDDADTDPRTEVGQVGAALNRLLGHVGAALTARHASETRVRQFVADASHELRTPLAAIRGYAELTRRSRQFVPEDVAHALSRVESEAIRMTGLVEDLLLLARLDSGRPVEVAPVDLSRIVVDALSDAHAAGPDHRWQLDVPDEPVRVLGDGARLHQVVANLLANSRTHTPPGTSVTVSVTRDDSTSCAVLEVLDDGPGIPETLQADVFERFARGDSSRSRAAGSTGLGLAIVSAVVDAHTGSVDVESRPGHTAFTVRLPLAEVAVA